MAVLKMQKINLCAMKKNRKRILEAVQAMGVVEVSSWQDEMEGFQKMDTSAQKSQFEKTAATIEQALEILEKYAPEKKGMLASLAGREFVSSQTFNKAMQDKNLYLSVANEIVQLEKIMAENHANILKMNTKIDNITPWVSMDIPMNTTGTKNTDVLIGTIEREVTQEQIYEILAANASEADVDVTVISTSRNQTCLVVICLKKDRECVEDALRTEGFARVPFLSRKDPAKRIEVLKEKIRKLEEETREAEAKMTDLAVNRDDLRLISDYFRIRAEKYRVLGNLAQSENTFFISGYVPEKEAGKVADILENRFDAVVEICDLDEGEESPVQLENNVFSASTEGVVESFGLPKKGEIDPTFIMSFFYVFLFGLMLSDAAYGLIISLACGIVLWKYKGMEEGLKKSLRMFFFCGLSTLFWGLMFGGFFGDLVKVVANTFFHKDMTLQAVWFEPLNDPMRLLLYSLLFGIIHLFTGLGIKGYMMIKDGRYLDCLYDVGFWFALLIGLLLLLIPSELFASIAGQTFIFPAFVNVLAKVLTIIGLVGIILMSGRRKKNPALRIALGLYDIYGLTSWLSDVLSYSRLLALGLATGVIAQVVNSMASMMGDGILGAIFFIVVFIIGHTLNLAINLLGAYVHTNRLQYVEFFGKFYEGGGRPFEPFKQNTKYIRIKEDV
ncbi:putative V-type sodium ATPase I subunit [Roseburia sp. CAG:303]|nr:putative V-type sodium ATPase I subunit [Roseburia sp. CAG:303]